MQVCRLGADERAGFHLLRAVADAGDDPDEIARAAIDGLPRLVASEVTTLSVCHLDSLRREVIGAPHAVIGPVERAAFDRHFRAHPLVRYHAYARGGGARRISDSWSARTFRDSALYDEYYRRIGIDHVVAVPVFVDEARLVSFVLNRRGRDFGERDVARLDLVGPPLARIWLGALERRRLEQDNARLRALLALGAPPDDALRRLTAREREVLRWVAAGKADRDIAGLLGCGLRTVHKHLQRTYVKLGVENRTAAAMRWLAQR